MTAKLPWSSDPGTTFESEVFLENVELLNNQDVIKLVKEINIYKSSGLPNINSRLLKDGFMALIDQFTFVLNLSLKTGIVPDTWKLGTITPIPKSGALNDVNNIRPISLTALPGKLLERHVHTQLVSFLEENNLLYENQGGFRKNKSTTQTVHHLINQIANAKNDDKYSLAVYLDISKAFDSINHDLLLQKLYKIGIRGMGLKWLQNYMYDRKQVVVNGGQESSKQTIICGVPQGSILGPLLFIIYMNDMARLPLTSNLLLFADDTVLYYNDRCIRNLHATVQKDLDIVINWCSFNKLCINLKKTKVTAFDKSFSKTCIANQSLHIFGKEIERIDRHEYLGIVVDDRLSFKYHNNKCSSRVNNRIYQLKKIRGCITTKCALSIYKTMILPLFEYGGLFLSSCTDKEQTKLQRLQNQALRVIYKEDNYANVFELHNISNLLPLKLRREMALIKIMFNKVHNNQGLDPRTLNTRAHDGPLMVVPKPNSSRYRNSVAYRGPAAWNILDPNIRCIENKNNFVRAVKSYYWDLYRTHRIS